MDLSEPKELLRTGAADALFRTLARLSAEAREFTDLIALSALRKKALARGLTPSTPGTDLRLAVVGGASLYPLSELLTHLLASAGVGCELFLGDYDNYVAELQEGTSALYAFRPNALLLLPASGRFEYQGDLTDARADAEGAAQLASAELLGLCAVFHERTQGEVLLCNLLLPAHCDLGELRSRLVTSRWNFRKRVNQELGLNAPAFVRICDLEFMAYRRGGLEAENARGWFESKQPCSPALLVDLCREAANLIARMRAAPKKVLVLDLDNTLWGGVLADDGPDGIELGDTSPRGEAFKAFQRYVASLKKRGVLLAVCSKNDHALAEQAVATHPEMVLRPADFVAFKANWEPKSDNLRQIAQELALGLDSFVFVDDNPAEVEIVRQFTPAVSTVLLDGDPADFVGKLADSRLFEPRSITQEDAQRTDQYRAERTRQAVLGASADMASYLASLEMQAVVRPFIDADVPRLAQLINKSNQFNLTTRRRTETEVKALVGDAAHLGISLRLRDKFSDHGLVCIVIGRIQGSLLELDTWLMSCRVLKRDVEETMLNEVARRARDLGCSRLLGIYRETAKNAMVRDFYPRMGFTAQSSEEGHAEYVLDLTSFQPRPSKIAVSVNA